MPLEATQLLYTARHRLEPDAKWRDSAPKTRSGVSGYAPYQMNGPLPRWVAASCVNYKHCVEYGLALCREYTRRYEQTHSCEEHIKWLAANPPHNLPNVPLTPIPILPKKNGIVRTAKTVGRAVRMYRRIFIREKMADAEYTKSRMPSWALKQIK